MIFLQSNTLARTKDRRSVSKSRECNRTCSVLRVRRQSVRHTTRLPSRAPYDKYWYRGCKRGIERFSSRQRSPSKRPRDICDIFGCLERSKGRSKRSFTHKKQTKPHDSWKRNSTNHSALYLQNAGFILAIRKYS